MLASVGLIALIFIARTVTNAVPDGLGSQMPSGARRVAYIALVVLMFGAATGMIGAS